MLDIATREARSTDLRFGWRFRLGMLLPSANRVAEADVARLLPPGASLHTTRLKLAGDSPEALRAMTEKVEEGAALLADADADLIVFHCTGVTTLDPDMGTRLAERITRATGLPATSTADSLLAAFRALAVRRIVLVTPYVDSVNQSEIRFFDHYGIRVLAQIGLGLSGGDLMAGVEPGEWYRRTLALRHAEADAYFLSCTNIRATPVIEVLERDLGKPVVTSNQAMVWHALRRAGIGDTIPGYGTLLTQ